MHLYNLCRPWIWWWKGGGRVVLLCKLWYRYYIYLYVNCAIALVNGLERRENINIIKYISDKIRLINLLIVFMKCPNNTHLILRMSSSSSGFVNISQTCYRKFLWRCVLARICYHIQNRKIPIIYFSKECLRWR